MLTIRFETHATSVDNERGVASGYSDVDLSARGEAQARELGARYRDSPPACVFCSDLRRSYRTAEIAFGGSGVPVVRDRRLRECDYGEFAGQPADLVRGEKLKRIHVPFPGGESYEQALERGRDFLAELRDCRDGQTILIIGHRATQHALEHWINGRSIEEALSAPFRWRPGWTYHLGAPVV